MPSSTQSLSLFPLPLFGLYYLREERQLKSPIGQQSFRVLIFQDMLAIPVLALIPIFGSISQADNLTANRFLLYLACLGMQLVFCFKLFPVISSWIKKRHGSARYFSFVLLFVLMNSLLTELYGLSTAFGAFFLAFLANSQDRSKILKFTIPLKTMLMGVFFLAVGLSVDLSYISAHFGPVIFLTTSFLAIKLGVFLYIGYREYGKTRNALRLPLILATGSEFGVMVLMAANGINALGADSSQLFSSVLSLSLLTAPLLNMIDSKFFSPRAAHQEDQPEAEILELPIKTRREDSDDSERKAA